MSTNGNNLQDYRRQPRQKLGMLRTRQIPAYDLEECDDGSLRNKTPLKSEILTLIHERFQTRRLATRQETSGSRISIRTMRSIYTTRQWQTPTRRMR